MALVPATLTINFTSNYAGPHRVCYRLNNTGAYDCTTVVTCTGGGAFCSATINIMVDNETCDSVEYDGYVQATCEDIGSLVGRVPFVITFIPNPTCKGYTVTCDKVSILQVDVTNMGSGYNPALPPAVTIAPPVSGTQATATAVISDNGILTANTTNPGAGYVDGTYTLVPAQTITGTGAGALFTVVVFGGVITAATPATPLDGGTGYAIGDTYDFNAANLGGAGGGCLFTVNALDYGRLIGVTMVITGNGYTSVPAATVPAPGAGVQALLLAVLDRCTSYFTGNNCDGSTPPSVRLPLGESTVVCNAVAPVATENYSSNLGPCCYACTTTTINKPDGSAQITYTDCETRNLIKTTITGPFNNTTCIVDGSLVVFEISGTPAVITTGAACTN